MTILLAETHDHDCHFNADDRLKFRATGVPSEDMVVALAWSYPQLLTWSNSGRHRPIWPSSDYQHSLGDDDPGEFAAIWLGRLCVLVANRSGIPVLGTRLGKFASEIPTIWPPSEEAVTWPPKQEVPMRGLESALNRGRGAEQILSADLREKDEKSNQRQVARVAELLTELGHFNHSPG